MKLEIKKLFFINKKNVVLLNGGDGGRGTQSR
jgi:hypothetical protein